ncbi:MAG: ATP-binding protein [Sulfurimonas sp.]|nr:ATP-binding protein [Sulfurimonas sp.]
MDLKKSTKNLKILYVEDSMMMRKVTHKLLSSYFDYIDVAKNGKEAIELYKNFYEKNDFFYDIVITDLEMPIMDGEELSKLVLKFNFEQEIIVLSGIEDFKKLINLINIGIKKFISKPIQNEQLADVISDVYQNIRIKQFQEKEKLEVKEYNKILKQREKEHQKALKEKTKQLEEFSLALNNSDIVVKTDINGLITYVNDHFCNISGYAREELVGQKVSIVNGGRKTKSFFKKLWNSINNKRIYKALFENKSKNGSFYYVESTINPIVDTDGNITEFIAVSHDMTQLMNSLEDLNKSKKIKEDFFINISHEMKTPLNSILGFSSLLKKRLANDEKSLLMISTIYSTGVDLNRLVESILDMRKIQEKSLEMIEVAFNPHDELDKCINKYMKSSYDKKQKYEVFIDSKIPNSLLGDPFRVMQVIGIFIENAIKFTQEEGAVQISVIYDNNKEFLICEVIDNGIGIAKQNQKKIFNMQQLDSKMSRSHEGAGLSLSIANNIIKIMKGNISLKSIPTKGSIFKLGFPLKK